MDVFTYTLIVVFFIFATILSFIDIKHQKIPRFLSFSFIGSIWLTYSGNPPPFLISNGESEAGSLSFSAFYLRFIHRHWDLSWDSLCFTLFVLYLN